MNKDKKMILGHVVGGLLVIALVPSIIINIFSVSYKIKYFEVCY